MRALFFLGAWALSGCAPDLCRGHDGTCIGLSVGGTVKQIDRLHVEVRIPDGDATRTERADAPGAATALTDLPITTAVYLDPAVIGPSTLFVEGLADGRVIGSAEHPLTIVSADHYEIDLSLAGTPGDGNACPSGALFCDDFEQDGLPGSATFGAWDTKHPFIIPNPTGSVLTLDLDGGEVFRGAHALLATENGGGSAVIEHDLSTKITSGTFALRGYVYAGAPLQDSTALFRLAIGADGKDALYFGAGASAPHNRDAGFWQITHGSTDTVVYGGAMPAGGWLCMEVVVDLDAGTASLYASDAFAPAADAPPVLQYSGTLGSVASVQVGLSLSPYAATQSVWFDDVAIATQRVGCE